MTKNTILSRLKVKIFADGAEINSIKNLCKNSLVKGFTTNPTLMKKNSVSDYKNFAMEVLDSVEGKPVSFEVFADDINQMEEKAMEISTWGKNANVKIPITNTKGKSTTELIKKLSNKKITCNVTAIFTLKQLNGVLKVLNPETPAILSIFAGRIADSGIDPLPIMKNAVELAKSKPKSNILWASTREVLNIFQAENTGCQIITVPNEILKKLSGIGVDLEQLSLETVSTFYKDAAIAGYTIETKKPYKK